MQALIAATSSSVIRPGATPRWLVTTTTRQPASASSSIACSAPGRNSNCSARDVLALGRLSVDGAVAVEEGGAGAHAPNEDAARPARRSRAAPASCPPGCAASGRRGSPPGGRTARPAGAARAGDGDRQHAGSRRSAAPPARWPTGRWWRGRWPTPPGPAERRHLAREHLLEAVVVADRRHRRAVVGQRQRGQRRALEQVAAGELGGDVLGVGGAAAVAEHSTLPPARKRSATLGGHLPSWSARRWSASASAISRMPAQPLQRRRVSHRPCSRS